jgi:hypothetical protein
MSVMTERDVLSKMLPELKAEGYEVYLHPNRTLLPPFFQDYTPDAIALRKDKNLAIQVSSRSSHPSQKISKAIQLFENQPKWELRLIWIESVADEEPLPVQTLPLMQDRIAEIQELVGKGHLTPSLLLGWATFEAVARAMLPKDFRRPQTPGRLVEILARDGYVTPTEAAKLRPLAAKRNMLIHGDLQVSVSPAEIADFVSIIEELRQQVPG